MRRWGWIRAAAHVVQAAGIATIAAAVVWVVWVLS